MANSPSIWARCIYGGIWAEMLEDRKFFYPLDAKESPWKSIDGAAVTMVREHAFVGQHSPRMTLAGGAEEEEEEEEEEAGRAGFRAGGRAWSGERRRSRAW